MNTNLIKEIVELTDERNYLRNILEAAEEYNVDIEDLILTRLDKINQKLAELEA